jgi:hypothetical protein
MYESPSSVRGSSPRLFYLAIDPLRRQSTYTRALDGLAWTAQSDGRDPLTYVIVASVGGYRMLVLAFYAVAFGSQNMLRTNERLEMGLRTKGTWLR